jgi:multidrug efflux pump
VKGPFFNDEFGIPLVLSTDLRQKVFSDRELRDRLEVIRADLLKIPDARMLGVQEEQISVEFSPRKIAALGLDGQKVMEALSAQNAVQPAGTVQLSDEKIALRVNGAFASEEKACGQSPSVSRIISFP